MGNCDEKSEGGVRRSQKRLKRVYAKKVALTVEEALCEGLLRRGAKRVCGIAFKAHR